jgi:CBS domain-containing protein
VQETEEESMNVGQLMTHEVVCVAPDALLLDALQEILAHDLNGVVVVSEDRRVMGIVTQGDIFRAVMPSEAEVMRDDSYFLYPEKMSTHIAQALHKRVGDIMATNVISVTRETPAALAGGQMVEKRIKQLPVVENMKLVGIITFNDISRKFLRDAGIPSGR